MSTGAALGEVMMQLFTLDAYSRNLLILSCMIGFLSGVTRSPFTAAILVLEMTDRHSAIFQLMYAAMVGYLISFAIDRKSYYHRMKERLLKGLPGCPAKPEQRPSGGATLNAVDNNQGM